MKVTEITEAHFRKMVAISSKRLSNNAEFINSLNVFPVPDGDTGTNMSLSFVSGAKYVSESTANTVGSLAVALAKGLLMGARGNSGVILSQIFRGFYKSTEKKDSLNANDLAAALTAGVETAYKAVMKPTEGTILTVAREAARAANKAAGESDDTVIVMAAAYEAAKKALATTPDLLPVLKEVGVVDSGGQGLTFVYEGFFDALSGNQRAEDDAHQPSVEEMEEMVNAEHHKSVQSQLSTEDIKYGYCTEIMVKLGAGRLVDSKFDYDEFRNHLNTIGDSLLVVADEEIVKVHVHTEHPGSVMSYGQRFGSLIKVKVDNMRLQHETILEHDEQEENKEEAVVASVNNEGYGIIAIASGDGIANLFKSLGATYVLSGGQTMNPSTQDIVDAIKKVNAQKVIILPNNKNIFLAAEQAAKVAEVPTRVVASRTIAQGMTALIAFNPEEQLDKNAANMSDEMDSVKSGQVTIAVRDTTIAGNIIKKDDYMGIIDGKIELTNPDKVDAAVQMVEKMLDDDSEIVTIIIGQDGTSAEAENIKSAVLKLDEDLEIEIHQGNQPVYPYLISVE
ncbi:DAK2 domain-containing protein [Lactobacillus sp. UCMA15818]|uniref:DAK2 domain-containing protein n=1 Tax=Lactobacillaceae TaxID=33958 RepID=UPI0025B000C7|nr:DAK2 domain-containing protein [Lactobacillus sp. UCMA15818]MDN2452576.1 DAK2 domain-containing protein [Lactobacillus sp. UCMA15818]